MNAGLPRFPPGNPVCALRAVMPLDVDEEGALRLPRVVLWALGLSEGDMLAVDCPSGDGDRARFRSYGERVRSAAEACSHPWPYVEELLRRPMAAVGAEGALTLPEETAARLGVQPGGGLLLRARVERGDRRFTLERRDGRQVSPELWAQARYPLAVEPDCRVTLPADALWALSLADDGPPESFRLEALLIPSTRVVLVVSLYQKDASFRLEPCLEI